MPDVELSGGATLAARTLTPFARHLHRRIADADRRLAPFGVNRSAFMVPEERLGHEVAMKLIDFAVDETKDSLLGVRIGFDVPAGTFGLAEHAAMAAPDLGTALKFTCKFVRIEHEAAESWLDSVGKYTEWATRFDDSLRFPAAAEDYVLASRLCLGYRIMSRPQRPLEIRLRHAAGNSREYERLFGCKVSFGHPHLSIVMKNCALTIPFPNPDPILFRSVEEQADTLLSRLRFRTSFALRVRLLVESQLETGCSLDGLAHNLGMGERTLRRRLREEGVTYSEIEDDVRRDRAKRYITKSSRTTAQIASSLGFARLTAFHRAFKRWTGLSPGEYRRTVPRDPPRGPDARSVQDDPDPDTSTR